MRYTSKIQWGRYSPALLTSHYSGDQKAAFELVGHWLESGLISYQEATEYAEKIKQGELQLICSARREHGGLYAGLINVSV